MARYLLHRISEQLNIVVRFDGALFPGKANSSSIDFSTKAMRSIGGIGQIKKAIEMLEKVHLEHLEKFKFGGYPLDVSRRINKWDDKEVGKFDVVIPEVVSKNGFGHLQDRRVPSNLDPYIVLELLIQTICLNV